MSDDSSDIRPEMLPSSPFAPADPTACPFAPDPKLSIRHLMVWGVCVAVYCSASQSVRQTGNAIVPNPPVLSAADAALESGTALVGLLLLLARRRRRAPYPRYGGEWLWTIAGIQIASVFGIDLLIAVAKSLRVLLIPLSMLACVILLGIAYIVAIVKCEGRRWKIVLLLMPVLTIATLIGAALLARQATAASLGIRVAVTSAGASLVTLTSIVIAALIDLRQPRRYPWTHWAGVLLLLWQSLAAIAAGLLVVIFS